MLNKQQAAHIKTTYGISLEEYEFMLDEQNNACAICKQPSDRHLYVDHDHETGLVRGLLCTSCNSGLGGFKDNQESLREAANYLEQAKNKRLRSESIMISWEKCVS